MKPDDDCKLTLDHACKILLELAALAESYLAFREPDSLIDQTTDPALRADAIRAEHTFRAALTLYKVELR